MAATGNPKSRGTFPLKICRQNKALSWPMFRKGRCAMRCMSATEALRNAARRAGRYSVLARRIAGLSGFFTLIQSRERSPSRRFEHDPLLAHVAPRTKNGHAVRLVALLRGAALVPIFSGPRRVRSRPLTDMTPLWRRICLRHTVAEPLRAGARHDDHLLGRRGRRSSNRTGGPRGFAMPPVAVSAGYISDSAVEASHRARSPSPFVHGYCADAGGG